MFLVAFSGGALLAPHTQFYTEIFCSRYYESISDDTLSPVINCAIPEVQKMVSIAQAIIMFLTYGTTLIGAGYYGRLSDLKGRTLILQISTLGTFIYVTCDLITAKYYKTIGISLLFIGPVFRGALAGEAVLMAAVQAYIAHCTSPSSRTVVYARLMASLFIGAAIGPFVSSLILKHTGSLVNVFYACLLVDFSNVIYAAFFVPESNEFALKVKRGEIVPDNKKAVHFWEKLNIFSALDILFKHPTSSHMNRHALPFIALAEFLLSLVKRPPTLLYAMLKFNWTAYEGSIYYTYASLTRLFIMIGVLPLLSKLFQKSCPKAEVSVDGEEKKVKNSALFDIWMVRIGIGIDAICLALSGLATSVTLFFLAGMLQSFSMLAQPSIKGLLTTLVEPSQVGELLGAVAILDSVAMIISHIGVNTIYSTSVNTMPNLTFFVLAVIAGCSCLAACLVRIKKDASETDELLHESALYRSMSNSSLVVDNYESVIDTQPRNRHQS
ncbi:unnamed protein product [Mucor hiemalis]